jgi:hypothetical protein
LAELYAADVALGEVAAVLRPLLERFAAERVAGEGLGDFYQRARGAASATPRRLLTGRETPQSLPSREAAAASSSPAAGVEQPEEAVVGEAR